MSRRESRSECRPRVLLSGTVLRVSAAVSGRTPAHPMAGPARAAHQLGQAPEVAPLVVGRGRPGRASTNRLTQAARQPSAWAGAMSYLKPNATCRICSGGSPIRASACSKTARRRLVRPQSSAVMTSSNGTARWRRVCSMMSRSVFEMITSSQPLRLRLEQRRPGVRERLPGAHRADERLALGVIPGVAALVRPAAQALGQDLLVRSVRALEQLELDRLPAVAQRPAGHRDQRRRDAARAGTGSCRRRPPSRRACRSSRTSPPGSFSSAIASAPGPIVRRCPGARLPRQARTAPVKRVARLCE